MRVTEKEDLAVLDSTEHSLLSIYPDFVPAVEWFGIYAGSTFVVVPSKGVVPTAEAVEGKCVPSIWKEGGWNSSSPKWNFIFQTACPLPLFQTRSYMQMLSMSFSAITSIFLQQVISSCLQNKIL